jgi:putative oxidoreductase
MNTILVKTGRIAFAIPVFIFGIFHFMSADAMAGMVPYYIPGGILWIYISGAGLVAVSISIIINVQARLACLLLAGMLLIFILTIHLPNILGNDEMIKMMSMTNMLKDLAIAASALIIAGISEKKIMY